MDPARITFGTAGRLYLAGEANLGIFGQCGVLLFFFNHVILGHDAEKPTSIRIFGRDPLRRQRVRSSLRCASNEISGLLYWPRVPGLRPVPGRSVGAVWMVVSPIPGKLLRKPVHHLRKQRGSVRACSAGTSVRHTSSTHLPVETVDVRRYAMRLEHRLR